MLPLPLFLLLYPPGIHLSLPLLILFLLLLLHLLLLLAFGLRIKGLHQLALQSNCFLGEPVHLALILVQHSRPGLVVVGIHLVDVIGIVPHLLSPDGAPIFLVVNLLQRSLGVSVEAAEGGCPGKLRQTIVDLPGMVIIDNGNFLGHLGLDADGLVQPPRDPVDSFYSVSTLGVIFIAGPALLRSTC